MALPGPAVVPVVPHSRAKNPVAKSLAFFHQHMEKSCDLCNREVGNFFSAFAGFAGERLGDLEPISHFDAEAAGEAAAREELLGLTRAVALEGLPHGITCNAVCPGTTETPVHQAAIHASMTAQSLTREEAERRFFATKQPTGRFISAEQVAALMVFLCGPEAADITGAALPVDGGWSVS